MELIFKSDTHSYHSIADPEKKWISVTRLIGNLKEPFDKETQAAKSSKNRKSKWYKMSPEQIIACWDNETERAVKLGTWYHAQREAETNSCTTIRREGLDLPIFQPAYQGEHKVSPEQTLVSGIYPEHFVYLKSAGICGQADRVEVIGNRVDIYDFKTNKELKTQGYTNWEGVTKKMLPPLNHLDDCHLVHYAIQLSIYMYIILKHNPTLVPGKLIIHHVVFEVDAQDDNGYPILANDLEGNPVIKEIVPYEVPYMEKEVLSLIEYVKLTPKIFEK